MFLNDIGISTGFVIAIAVLLTLIIFAFKILVSYGLFHNAIIFQETMNKKKLIFLGRVGPYEEN